MEYDEILQQIIEFLGTFAFAISGIRHAAAKHFDWFGGYVCGIAVAIGGGTIRDVMLGTTPFWMTNPFYMICTALALIFVVIFAKHMEGLRNTWFVFDTLGLALFTIAGIQKSLVFGQPYWVAIIMGCITGSAGVDKTYQLKVYDSADNKKLSKPAKPISVLAKTNVVVGKAKPGATVYVQYNKKKYSAKADADGYYRIVTATLKKGNKVLIWQKLGSKTSGKLSVKVVAGY